MGQGFPLINEADVGVIFLLEGATPSPGKYMNDAYQVIRF